LLCAGEIGRSVYLRSGSLNCRLSMASELVRLWQGLVRRLPAGRVLLAAHGRLPEPLEGLRACA
jgi:hypothetical protein